MGDDRNGFFTSFIGGDRIACGGAEEGYPGLLICGDVDGRMTLLRAYRPLIHHDLCIRCGTCADLCRPGCIHRRRDGFFHPDVPCCRGCGVCSRACPEGAIEMAEIGGIFVLA